MTTIDINNVTPTRKRKRDSDKVAINENISFSSTPKMKTGKRRGQIMPKEPYTSNSCMEVKSIAELVQKEPLPVFNPYEVQRKPPKKKKRDAIEDAFCFENPALNLNLPEKQFNPYEIVRDTAKCEEDKRKCFVNEALNIKSQDSELTVRNPFEIERVGIKIESNIKSDQKGIENPGLDEAFRPTSLKLGVPFTPTVGCRIHFNNVSLSQLTPNKLLLAEKLVFSPVPNNVVAPKRSLDAISEESSSVSIGKELDRYQLELENSINEAKLLKNVVGNERIEEECVYQLQLKVERRMSINQKLANISESEEYEIQEEDIVNIKELNVDKKENTSLEKSSDSKFNKIEAVVETKEELLNEDDCNVESDYEEESFDFKAPAPFVRAYRRDTVPNSKLAKSKDSHKSNSSSKSLTEGIEDGKHHNGVKNLIRRSIRKIISHQKDHRENIDPSKIDKEINEEKDGDLYTHTKQNNIASNIFSSIRHSLRRKPKEKINSASKEPIAEISIIDCSERTLKLKSSSSQNEYIRIEELTNERRHNSLRRSTREQLMKTFFQHKHEEYCFRN